MAEQFVVEDDKGPDLEFEGELLMDEQFHDIGIIQIYRTAAGMLVAKRRLSSRPGVIVKNEVKTFEDAGQLADWLGYTPGAKAVRKRLELATTRHVD